MKNLPPPSISELLDIPQSMIRKYDLQSLARQLYIAPASKTRAQLVREIEARLRNAATLPDRNLPGFRRRRTQSDSGTVVVQMCSDGSRSNRTPNLPRTPYRNNIGRNGTPSPQRPMRTVPRNNASPRPGPNGGMRPIPPPPPPPPPSTAVRGSNRSGPSARPPALRASPIMGPISPRRMSLKNALHNQFRKNARVQNRIARERVFE